MLGSLAAIAVVLVGGFFAIRSVGINEAERDTRERVQAAGRLVEASGLTDGILKGDPDSIAKLDDIVVSQVLSPSIVRVKLWSENGTILYSDEAPLIGQRFKLGDEEAALLREGEEVARVLDLPWQGEDPEHHERAAQAEGRVVLAGKLAADNVAEAIARVRPWAVDASSRLEAAPGVKDHAKVRAFVEAARC